jgi:hypothetical protein
MSRVALKQMRLLLDAAVKGTIEGYDRYERFVDTIDPAPFSETPLPMR